MLISVAELAEHLDDPSWMVFDCRHDLMDLAKGERLYREGHIAGARFANLDTDLSGEKTGLNGRHPLPSPAAVLAFLARSGVTNTSTVVAYDDVGGQFAARLWWLARWVGVNAALLDGGIQRWLGDGQVLVSTVPSSTRATGGALLAGRADPLLLTTADEILPRLHAPDFRLIDARAPERFRGDVEPIDRIAGHIPGAINHFYKNNLNADLTFKPVAEVRAGFQAMLGDTPDIEVVHQCGSGVTACANIFAMEYAGLTGSRLYAGSWSEWIADPARPIARAETANLRAV